MFGSSPEAGEAAPRDDDSARGARGRALVASLESVSVACWPSVEDRTALGCPERQGWTVNEIPSTPDGNLGTVHPLFAVSGGKARPPASREPASEDRKGRMLW